MVACNLWVSDTSWPAIYAAVKVIHVNMPDALHSLSIPVKLSLNVHKLMDGQVLIATVNACISEPYTRERGVCVLFESPVAMQMEYLRPLTCSILSERRALRPYGLLGGHSALPGLNLLLHPDGRKVNMGGKTSVQVKAGDRIRILTPGMQCLTVIQAVQLCRCKTSTHC